MILKSKAERRKVAIYTPFGAVSGRCSAWSLAYPQLLFIKPSIEITREYREHATQFL